MLSETDEAEIVSKLSCNDDEDDREEVDTGETETEGDRPGDEEEVDDD